MKKYKNKDWLYKKYYDEELNITEMAEIAGCSGMTICNWMDKFGYERRSNSEAHKGIEKIEFFKDWTEKEIKDWLHEKYWEEKLSMYEIAKEVECCCQTIYNWMKKLDIEKRSISKARLKSDFFENWSDKEIKKWLYKKYWEEELSMHEIAELAECTLKTIFRWMKKFGIKRRSISEANKLKFKDFKVRQKIKDNHWTKRNDADKIEKKRIQKISEAHKGKKLAKKHKQKLSNNHWIKRNDAEEIRQKISETIERAWENGIYDDKKNGRQIYEYTKSNGEIIYLDSSWELELCKDLDENNKKYIRPNGNNGHRFEWVDEDGKQHFYTSDLYLIEENVYLEPHWYKMHEIYKSNRTKKDFDNKIKRVQEQNNIKIIILDFRDKCNWEYIKKVL